MTPTVSICIPVYNGADYIATAVRSVLAQSYEDFELIVVDNVSTDDTVAIVESFGDPRIRLERPEGFLGAVPNWNRATALCHGRYVKLLCADDALAPDCLALQVAALDTHPQAALAAGKRDIVDDEERVLIHARGLARMRGYVDGRKAIRTSVRHGTNVFGEPACVLMRGETLRRAGAWSEDRAYMVDVDLYFRLLTRGGLVAIRRPVAMFRVHTASWSSELATRQAHQARELFSAVRHAPASTVTTADLLLGDVRAELLRVGRRLVYTRAFRMLQERRGA